MREAEVAWELDVAQQYHMVRGLRHRTQARPADPSYPPPGLRPARAAPGGSLVQ